ncbi:MAG: glycosyltransferase [Acidobacteriota bacterium]|nr:glycosyltransferase [Acidobacteriota bacterium]
MNRALYIQYTNPAGYPPLQHSSRILADAGWQVLFLGTGAAGSNVLAFPDHPNITVHRMKFCSAGWKQKLHFLTYCAWALWTALTWRPKWVYASDPLSCPAAFLLSWIPGIQVLYHEHDAPGGDPAGSGFLRFIAGVRRSVAQRAALCVLPNAKRLERFQRECGPLESSVCVWNCPALTEAIREPRLPVADTVWLLYHGSIVPERLPPTILDALALLPSFVKLRVAGYETVGSRGYVAELRRRAEASGLVARVEFLSTIPQRADLLRATAQSDIGLALMPMNTSDFNCETMTGASNKAFDYLACGLALVVSNLPDWREMFIDEGYAAGCDPQEPGSIAAAIGSLIEDLPHMRATGESGRQKILKAWNYESVFQPVFERFSGTAGVGAAAAAIDRQFENAR